MNEFFKHNKYYSRKNSRSILQAKGHQHILERSPFCCKGRLVSSYFNDFLTDSISNDGTAMTLRFISRLCIRAFSINGLQVLCMRNWTFEGLCECTAVSLRMECIYSHCLSFKECMCSFIVL